MATIADLRASRKGIKKSMKRYTLNSLGNLLESKAIVVASWNRHEVQKRPGSSSELMASMARGWSIGLLVGYWNGLGEIMPTATNPIAITEGGHRLRWLLEILGDRSSIDGHTLTMLKSSHPDLAEAILQYPIAFEVATHESGKVPEEYMKGEYKAVNVTGAVLTAGETLRASTDEAFNGLVEELDDAWEHRKDKLDKLARDKKIELQASVIAGLVLGLDNMKANKDVLLGLQIPEDKYENAMDILCHWSGIERALWARYKENKFAKKILQDVPKLELYGPMFAGLMNAAEDDRDRICQVILKFFEKSLVDKDTWTLNSTRIKKAPTNTGNGGGRLNKARYEHCWSQLVAVVNGTSSHQTTIEEALDVPDAV